MNYSQRKIYLLAWPISLQMMAFSFTSLLDNLMVGQLGELSISAVGNASQLLFFFILTCSMLDQGGGIIIAQLFGARKYKSLRKTISSLIVYGSVAGLILGLTLHIFGEFFLSILTLDIIREVKSPVPSIGSLYLKIVGLALVFQVPSGIALIALQSMGDTRGPMKISMLGVLINAIGNFILIFGGAIPGVTSPIFTPLGIQGIAIATAISWFVVAILSIRRLFNHSMVCLRLNDLSRPLLDPLLKVMRIGYPLSLDGFLWQGAAMFYVVLFNWSGTEAFAAYIITLSIRQLFFVPGVGIEQSLSILIGQALGRNAFKQAKALRYIGLKTGVTILPVIALFLALVTPQLLHLYDISDQAKTLVVNIMIVHFVFSIAGSITSIVPGILRSGGQSKAVMSITAIGFFLFGAPVSLLLTFYFESGVWGVVYGYVCDEVSKAVLFMWYQSKNHWVKNVLGN